MPTTRRPAHRLVGPLLLAALAGTATFVLAPRLAAGISYVVPSGVSMQPTVHAGDLVLLRAEDSYRVGEVIGYRSPTLHTVVLHRIRATGPTGFTTRGDANSWVDPDHPQADQVLGALWVRVPRLGALLRIGGSGPSVPVLALAGLLLLAAGARTAGRARPGPHPPDRHASRRRRGPVPGRAPAGSSAGAPPGPSGRGSGPSMAALSSAAASLALVAATVGGLAFALPLERNAQVQLGYRQTLAFGYSAAAPPGVAYPDGRVHWGDPVYVRLVRALRVEVRQSFTGPAGQAPPGGTLTLRSWLESSSGWHAPAADTVTVPLQGASGTASAVVDPASLARVAAGVERASGVPLGPLTLHLEAVSTVRTTVEGRPLVASTTAPLRFRLDGAQLVLLDRDPATTQAGSLAVTRSLQRTVGVLGTAVPVRWLRIGALAALLSAAALLALRAVARRLPVRAGQVARRYPDRIVHVRGVDPAAAHVEVAAAGDLLRLADQTSAVIVHFGPPGADGYELEVGGTRYRYTDALHAAPPRGRGGWGGGEPRMRRWRTTTSS